MATREKPGLMLCELIEQPFDDSGWVFEPKYDGLRLLCRFDGRRVELLSRNGKVQNASFPEVAEALARALKEPAVVDGELVCLGEDGKPSFKALQQRMHLLETSEVGWRLKLYRAELHVFDLLKLGRRDIRGLPLERRKKLLRGAIRWNDLIQWTPATLRAGVKLFRQACRRSDEGVIGKRLDSPYVAGRPGDWVKVKCVARQELVVGGFTDPQRSRVGLGALLVGYYDKPDGSLVYAGKVGTGFTRETLLELREKLERLEQWEPPFGAKGLPRGEGVHWVSPELVAEIAFAEWTRHGILRQPRFEGLRADKDPRQVRRERSQAPVMALEKYRKMRRFKKTPEPRGRVRKGPKAVFVIQKHAATRLHFDFRLESGGVLKSWAITNEPSLDPKIRRLAIEVEDHSVEYAGFEGDIPEGEYGAGHVEIWDRGTYELLGGPEGDFESAHESGHIKIRLRGKKLSGAFALIRMKARRSGKPQWLFIKVKDEKATRDVAARVEPSAPRKRSAARRKTAVLHTSGIRLIQSGRPRPVRFTHLKKVMFPAVDLRKEDVVRYYERIAPFLLPYLRGRPITLERLPEGLSAKGAPHFWQKNTPKYYPDWIPRLEIPSETGKPVDYVLVNNVETLLYLVNLGALTFHIWPSQLEQLDRPDFVLFDLDPGEADFAAVVRVAREVRKELKAARVPGFVKTSGKSGLHVLVPWRAPGGYEEARAWALSIAKRVVRSVPKLATVERSKSKRHGRVYLDVMQNARGHHVVPPFVIRPVPEATVSMPLRWEEIDAKLDPRKFSIRTVVERLERDGFDPMAELLSYEAEKEAA